MKLFMIIAATFLVSLSAQGDDSAPGALTISVTNIENGSGTIYVAILDSAENWLKSDAKSKPFRDVSHAVTSTDNVTITVSDLPPGKYAISLFHDLDGDAEMDTNFIGFPKEPFGFSAPMGKFGPPGFDEAAVEFTGENASVEIALN